MNPEAYELMAAHEHAHWWFVGRRAVINALLDRVPLDGRAKILEAGCGTGGNLYMLQRRGDVFAFDPSEQGRAWARARFPDTPVVDGALPERLPFPADSFDLVVALDVLEHVRDDAAALRSLVAQAKPGGWVIVTVPAHPVLWGSHDRRLHHIRRYRPSELRRICAASGADLEYFTAFNTILSPIAIVLRLAERLSRHDLGNQERMPPTLINAVLAWFFSLERHLVRRVPIPFGLSLAAVLRRNPGKQQE